MITVFSIHVCDHPGLFLYDTFLKVGVLGDSVKCPARLSVHLTSALAQSSGRARTSRLGKCPRAHTLADAGSITITIVTITVLLIVFLFGRQRFSIA